MLKSRRRHVFGSSRTSFFREKSRSVRETRQRSQRIKFRKRHAQTMAMGVLGTILGVVKIVVVIAAVGAAGWAGRRAWVSAEWLRVDDVRYEGYVTQDLKDFLAIKTGDHLLKLRPSALEQKGLQRFKELKRILIKRTPGGLVEVNAIPRVPVCILSNRERPTGVDDSGVSFYLVDGLIPAKSLPELDAQGSAASLKIFAAALAILSDEVPEFSGLVRIVKTDTMQPTRMQLHDGVVIHWGDLKPETAVQRAQRILAILNAFEPKKAGAALRFVSDDRVVMDANWSPKSQRQLGGSIVKT